MNYHIACERLQLDPYSIHDQKRIKKQYHLLALKFHPDKNKDENAHDHFLEIQEAYHFLMKTNHKPEIPPYEAFVRFFKGTLDEQTRDDYLHGALDKILSICEKQAIQIIDHVPYAKFQKIYNIVTKYKHIFALSPEFYKDNMCEPIYLALMPTLMKGQVQSREENFEIGHSLEEGFDLIALYQETSHGPYAARSVKCIDEISVESEKLRVNPFQDLLDKFFSFFKKK